MAIGNFTEDLNIISKLGNNPNSDDNLSDAGLKAKFDAGNLLIQKFLNNVIIPAINKIEGAVGFKGTHGELTGRDVANQHPISAVAGLQDALNAANNAANNAMAVAGAKAGVSTETAVLYSNAWVNNQVTVNPSVVPVTAKAVIVSPDPASENYEAYNDCGIRCISQNANGLVFACDSVPDIHLTVNLVGIL